MITYLASGTSVEDLVSSEKETWKTSLREAWKTPLREACLYRQANDDMVNSFSSWKMSGRFHRLDALKYLVNISLKIKHLLQIDYERDMTGLEDIGSFCGYFDTVKPVQVESSLVWESGKENLQILRELLKPDSNLCLLQDKEVKTPLHWGAVTGRVNFLEQILSKIVDMVTKQGETALHLTVQNNKIDTIRYLMENLHIIKLANSNDSDGNTILHLETTAKLAQISIVESDVKNCIHLDQLSFSNVDTSFITDVSRRSVENTLKMDNIPANCGAKHLGSVTDGLQILLANLAYTSSGSYPLASTLQSKNGSQLLPQSPETLNLTSTTTMSMRSVENSLKMDKTPTNFHHSKLYNHSQAMHNDIVREEGLLNIRHSMAIVSVLIVTVSFTAGIYASSDVHQEGMTSRKSSLARTTAYMVFLLCNNVAFFSSLGNTAALFSANSFTRKSIIKLLAVTEKIMWVSLSFMVAAHIAMAFMHKYQIEG